MRLPALPSDISTILSLICCCSDLVRTEKRKLNAATTVEVPTPATLLGFENTPLQLPVAQLQPCPAGVSARAFATGAVAIALPASAPALQQAANLPAMGRLPDGGLLRGH